MDIEHASRISGSCFNSDSGIDSGQNKYAEVSDGTPLRVSDFASIRAYFFSSFSEALYPAFSTAAMSFFESALPFSTFTTALSGWVTSALMTP